MQHRIPGPKKSGKNVFTALASLVIILAAAEKPATTLNKYWSEIDKMSVDVKAEVVIERPRSEVAKMVFNPKSDPIWHTCISKSFPQTAGLLKRGSKVEHVGTFAGKAYSAEREVMRDEPEKSLDMTSNEPFEMKIRYSLDDVPEGTKVSVRVQSVGELLFKMPPAVLSKKVEETIHDDLKRLKRFLEQNHN